MVKTLVDKKCPFLSTDGCQAEVVKLAEACFTFAPPTRIGAPQVLQGLRMLSPAASKKDIETVAPAPKQKPSDGILNAAELEFGSQLGSGGFGAVYRGKYKGTEVAIKKLHLDNGQVSQVQIDEFKKEVANLMDLRHPRLISFIGAAHVPPSLCIVTEFMNNGSLYELLHQRKVALTMLQRNSLACHTCEGVVFLHGRTPPFVHRDMKSMNVVLDKELNAKLCDFGLTQSMEKTHISRKDNEGGSPRYMAPELFDSKGKITEKVDIWALGCLILEIYMSRVPHEECNSLQQVMMKTLVDKKCPFLSTDGCHPEVVALAEACFAFAPPNRTGAKEVLQGLRMLGKD
jgi:serine/threonine protein kinase